MVNEWFFKWHHIGRDRPVEIESFRGKPIVYGGIAFGGSAHKVYWDTIQFYLRKKVSSLFDALEDELHRYTVETRRASIIEAETLISGFAGRIRKAAVDKDRILRGDGHTFPEPHDFGRWEGSSRADVERRAKSLLAKYCEAAEKSAPVPLATSHIHVENMHGGAIQQATTESTQVVVHSIDISKIASAAAKLEEALDTAELPRNVAAEIRSDLATIKAQLAKASPSRQILAEAGKSLRNLTEGIVAGAMTSRVIEAAAVLGRALGLG